MANSIDTDVIQDGQLVRSVIVQEGTVLKSGGKIDTKSLVQTADGAQLCDNVYIVGGGGGGSSLPSQTGQSGKFLTTDGTSASWASLPRIAIYVNGGSGKYIRTNLTLPLNTANSWEIQTVYTENGGGSSSGSIVGLGGSYNQDHTNPILIFQSGYLKTLLGSNSSSWDINEQATSLSLQTGHTYYIKWGFTGSAYYIDYNETGWGDTFTNVFLLQSTKKVYCSTPLCFLGSSAFATQAYANGPIVLSDTKVYIDNELVFDGSNPTLYINNGCAIVPSIIN